MPELVRENKRTRSRPNARAVEDDDILNARARVMHERFADASGARERGDDEDIDRRRIAVVERLDERAFLDGARRRVDVREVLDAVGEIDFAEAGRQARITRERRRAVGVELREPAVRT